MVSSLRASMGSWSLVAAALGGWGCGGGNGDAEEVFRQEVQPLFEEKCSPGCHEPDGFNGELFLGDEWGPETFIGVESSQAPMNLVEPGDLEESYLWHKLSSTHKDVGGSGQPMPYADWPLPDDDLATIEEYILMLGE